MEKASKAWNYGSKKDKNEKPLLDEGSLSGPQGQKMTLGQHMTRKLELNELFLLIVLIFLMAIFIFIFLNPLENPLKEKDRYNNL